MAERNWSPERDGCIHGRRMDQDCRLCELIAEKEMNRQLQPLSKSTAGLWLMILVGATVWLVVIIWRYKG